jgi:hypothetical protein
MKDQSTSRSSKQENDQPGTGTPTRDEFHGPSFEVMWIVAHLSLYLLSFFLFCSLTVMKWVRKKKKLAASDGRALPRVQGFTRACVCGHGHLEIGCLALSYYTV